jgi:N-acetylglutamate synthase-like GNAT family acetyltransferase
MGPMIRACKKEDTQILAETVRKSFQDVAERFGLTKENAPRHPSNCTVDWIQKDMDRGVTYFVLENENRVAGCVALEVANQEVCYLERLAVLPDQRKRGFGKLLVNHALSDAKRFGVNQINIGIIATHSELKAWYKKIGFIEGESKDFTHLPFRVTFMTYKVDNELPTSR